MWDCPGFGDNRGIAQDITNAFYVKELLSHARSVKFIFVSGFNDLYSNDVKQFIDLLKGVNRMLPDPTLLTEGISIIFTKVEPDFKEENLTKLLYNKLIKSGIGIEAADKKLVLHFVSNPKAIGVFRKPIIEGDLAPLTLDSNIIQSLTYGSPIAHDRLLDVTPSISARSELFLRKHYDEISGTKELSSLLIGVNKFFTEIMENIKSKIEEAEVSDEVLNQVKTQILPIKKIVEETIDIAKTGTNNNLTLMLEKMGDFHPEIERVTAAEGSLISKVKFLKFLDQAIKPQDGKTKLQRSEVFINEILSVLHIIDKDIGIANIKIDLKLLIVSREEADRCFEESVKKCHAIVQDIKLESEKLEEVNKRMVDSQLNITNHVYLTYRSPWMIFKSILKEVVVEVAAVVTEVARDLLNLSNDHVSKHTSKGEYDQSLLQSSDPLRATLGQATHHLNITDSTTGNIETNPEHEIILHVYGNVENDNPDAG